MTAEKTIRRALMTERDQALAAGNIRRYQELTIEISKLPIAGVPALTAIDIARYQSQYWK